jgi:hypothetical protein
VIVDHPETLHERRLLDDRRAFIGHAAMDEHDGFSLSPVPDFELCPVGVDS